MLPRKHFPENVASWLYSINVWLGFLPSEPYGKIQSRLLSSVSSIQTYTVAFLTTIMFCYCLSQNRDVDGYGNHMATHLVLAYLSFIFMYVSIMVTLIYVRIVHGAAILKLLRRMNEIDAKLETIETQFAPGWQFTLEIILAGVLTIFYLIYEEIARNAFYIFASYRKILIVCSIILGLQIQSFAIKLQRRFREVNRLLGTLLVPWNGKNGSIRGKHIFSIYLELINTVHEFNAIFGWQILFLCGTFVLCILHVINLLIEVLNFENLNDVAGSFWTMFLSYLLTTMVICIPFATSCNSAAEEAKATSLLAYSILGQKRRTVYAQEHQQELQHLASVPWPGFSAAGFFNVDHTMLFSLFGSVTSYLIVLIQLKDMRF